MSKPLTDKVALVTGGHADWEPRPYGCWPSRAPASPSLTSAPRSRRKPSSTRCTATEPRPSPSSPTRPTPVRRLLLIDDVVAHFGGLDILVNNAAISVEQGRTVDDPDADTAALDRMHATNYLGVIAVIRAASACCARAAASSR